MADQILLALWFFAPAGAANVMPILAAQVPALKKYDQPIDGGRKWRHKRILGDHKTWRGLIAGVLAAIVALWLQVLLEAHSSWLRSFSGPVDYANLNVIFIGTLFGLGALGGDALKSFFKRQFAIKPGQSWFPFDQIDYVIGGALLTAPFVPLDFWTYCWVFILWTGIHLFSSYLGWLWSLKDQPL